MKPTNSIYVGGPLLDPPDESYFCPDCGNSFDTFDWYANHKQAGECRDDAENNDYPE